MILTIAIPTYNRNETLAHNIRLLLPQLTSECRLLVLDNASPAPVEETLGDVWSQFPDVQPELCRNDVNIGGNANILRCLEKCQTPWIWILGDDDEVKPQAIQTILKAIAEYPDAVLLNFAADELRPQSWQARGLTEVTEKLDKSADLPWVSSSVYRAVVLRPNLKFGYQHCYALLPHLATLLMSIGEDGFCYFSPEQIVSAESRQKLPEPSQQWSLVNLALGFPTLMDLPLKPRVRELLFQKLLDTNHGEGIHLRGLIFQLLLTGIKEGDHRNAVYYFDQTCARAFYFQSPWRKLQLRFYRLIVRYPHLVQRIFKLARGREIGDQNYQNRYERV